MKFPLSAMFIKKAVISSLFLVLTVAHGSTDTLVEFSNPEKQALYNQLIKELRCLVCQNQNLADSNADLAKDLREKTYTMVDQGMDYESIIKFMVDRYGDFVLYRPPVKPVTLILWFSPFAMGGLLVLFIIKNRRSNKNRDTVPATTAVDLEKARHLIDASRDDI